MRLPSLALALLIVVAATARADEEPDVDPDTERARDHFQKGRVFYEARQYQEALREFELARRVAPLAAFDFNIARCHDRLGHDADALEWYRRYVTRQPTPADAAEVEARIAVLERRLREAQGGAIPPTVRSDAPVDAARAPVGRRRPSLGAPLAVGALTLGVAVLGTALVASVAPDYNQLRQQQLNDPDAMLQGQARDLQGRALGGYVTWGISGALAVVDVVLFVALGRRVVRR